MEPDRPGWYHDSRRPGLRRYWDGDAWVDVDQVADTHQDPRPTSAPLLVAQRRRGEDQADGVVDDDNRPPAEPEALSD